MRECIVPHEVLKREGYLFIGIRGVNADEVAKRTTTVVRCKIREGAPSGDRISAEPSPNVYEQILTAYGLMANEVTDIRNGYDGTEYETAGDAVRGQSSALHIENEALKTLISKMGAKITTLENKVATLEANSGSSGDGSGDSGDLDTGGEEGLTAPSIARNGDTLTITGGGSECAGYQFYIDGSVAYKNGEAVIVTTKTVKLSKILSLNPAGSYRIHVRAVNEGKTAYSGESNAVIYDDYLLAPVLTTTGNNFLRISLVNGATRYYVYDADTGNIIYTITSDTIAEGDVFAIVDLSGYLKNGTTTVFAVGVNYAEGDVSARSNSMSFAYSAPTYTLTVTLPVNLESEIGAASFAYWKDGSVNMGADGSFEGVDGTISGDAYNPDGVNGTVTVAISGITNYVCLAQEFQNSIPSNLVNCSIENITANTIGSGNGEAYRITLTGNASITFTNQTW